MTQHTVKAAASCSGIGVHTGAAATLTLRPAPVGVGLVFKRSDITEKDNLIPARAANVRATAYATTLENAEGASVMMAEHLLAACAGLGVDNAYIELDGPEAPILDGSSTGYCALIRRAGLLAQAAPRRFIRLVRPIEARHGEAVGVLSPSPAQLLEIRAEIDFDCPAIGRQSARCNVTPEAFESELAFARTFAQAKDLGVLSAMGLARGGSLDNAVLVDGGRVLNCGGLRADDEFVRHKMLDAVGDLVLAGAPIAGVYTAERPGHSLNVAMVRALLDSPSAWVWETDAALENASAA